MQAPLFGSRTFCFFPLSILDTVTPSFGRRYHTNIRLFLPVSNAWEAYSFRHLALWWAVSQSAIYSISPVVSFSLEFRCGCGSVSSHLCAIVAVEHHPRCEVDRRGWAWMIWKRMSWSFARFSGGSSCCLGCCPTFPGFHRNVHPWCEVDVQLWAWMIWKRISWSFALAAVCWPGVSDGTHGRPFHVLSFERYTQKSWTSLRWHASTIWISVLIVWTNPVLASGGLAIVWDKSLLVKVGGSATLWDEPVMQEADVGFNVGRKLAHLERSFRDVRAFFSFHCARRHCCLAWANVPWKSQTDPRLHLAIFWTWSTCKL